MYIYNVVENDMYLCSEKTGIRAREDTAEVGDEHGCTQMDMVGREMSIRAQEDMVEVGHEPHASYEATNPIAMTTGIATNLLVSGFATAAGTETIVLVFGIAMTIGIGVKIQKRAGVVKVYMLRGGKIKPHTKCNQIKFKPKSHHYYDYQQMALRLIEPVGEVINLEISGVHSEWTMYCFEIDINSPGKKIIAFRVKEDPFKAKSTDPDTENKADDSETICMTVLQQLKGASFPLTTTMPKKAPKPPPKASPPTDQPNDPRPPPSRHQCSRESACSVLLSDIGKKYHTFPTGTFRLRFTPPTVPKFVLSFFAAHPFTWRWTTKGGPNKGKSFLVHTIPTACTPADHRAVRWTVDLFHSFKAHLSPDALLSGKVPVAIVQLYQNNMLIHFRVQLRASRLLDATTGLLTFGTNPNPSAAEPHATPADANEASASTPTLIPAALEQRISTLEAELTELRKLLQGTRQVARTLAPISPPGRATPPPKTPAAAPRPPPTPVSARPNMRSRRRQVESASSLPTLHESPSASQPVLEQGSITGDNPTLPPASSFPSSSGASVVVEQEQDSTPLGQFPSTHPVQVASSFWRAKGIAGLTVPPSTSVFSVTVIPSSADVLSVAAVGPNGSLRYVALVGFPEKILLLEEGAGAPPPGRRLERVVTIQ
ncbi:hypothetical protein EV363DRAFT_1474188 [Boletus edulis]|nr:hypothetical protein EV363DRAFT_1474188 [Boletus edulis]